MKELDEGGRFRFLLEKSEKSTEILTHNHTKKLQVASSVEQRTSLNIKRKNFYQPCEFSSENREKFTKIDENFMKTLKFLNNFSQLLKKFPQES
jgi:hypothetical protein